MTHAGSSYIMTVVGRNKDEHSICHSACHSALD